MKITKRQLKRIIREERARLNEGRMAEAEMRLIDLIVDELIQAAAIGTIGESFEAEPDYAEAAEYLKLAVIPTLLSLAKDQRDDDDYVSPYSEPSRV